MSKVTVTGQQQPRQPAIDWPVTVTSRGLFFRNKLSQTDDLPNPTNTSHLTSFRTFMYNIFSLG